VTNVIRYIDSLAVVSLTLAFHLMPADCATGAGMSAISKSISCWKVTGSCRGHSVFSFVTLLACGHT